MFESTPPKVVDPRAAFSPSVGVYHKPFSMNTHDPVNIFGGNNMVAPSANMQHTPVSSIWGDATGTHMGFNPNEFSSSIRFKTNANF